MNAFDLAFPTTLQAAVEMLDTNDPTVRVMSGGTALMLMMKSDVFRPSRLISLRDIEAGYRTLGLMADGNFRIGALTTLSTMERDNELFQFAPVIRHTMQVLSTVRVRNVATIGGSLAHGDPHMDLPPVLVALGAYVVTLGPNGERRIPVADLHTGYYETVLAGDELIREIIIPPQGGRRATYLKCTTRARKDWPALGVAVAFGVTESRAQNVSLVVGSVGERPLTVPEAQAALEGRTLDAATIDEAARLAAEGVETIADDLGSAAYKKQLVRVYVTRALNGVASQNS